MEGCEPIEFMLIAERLKNFSDDCCIFIRTENTCNLTIQNSMVCEIPEKGSTRLDQIVNKTSSTE